MHNTSTSQACQTPLRLVTGLEPQYPGIDQIKNVDEEMRVEERIGKLDELRSEFRSAELERMLMKCVKTRVPPFKHELLKKNDKVVVQEDEKKEWSGPFVVEEDPKVNNEVRVRINGGVREINWKRVAKYYDWNGIIDEEEVEDKVIQKSSV